MRRLLLLTFVIVLLAGCVPMEPTPPPSTVEPTPARPAGPLRVAIVYLRSHNDDPDLYLRAGFYHQMRQLGYYRGDGTLSVYEFPLEVDPQMSEAELDALVKSTRDALDPLPVEALLTIGPIATARIAPAYAEKHVTTPVFYAAIPMDMAEELGRYPSIVGLPHARHPAQTITLAAEMMQETPARVLILGAGEGAVEATAAYQELQQTFPEIDFSLYTTERFLVWKEILGRADEEADAVLLISWEGLHDEQWEFVPADQVLDWTIVHSPLPLFALDEKAVRRGAAGGLVASSWETGKSLADLVSRVMVWGQHPSALSSKRYGVNLLSINLRGVSRWNLEIPAAVALTAATFTDFPASGDSDETP